MVYGCPSPLTAAGPWRFDGGTVAGSRPSGSWSAAVAAADGRAPGAALVRNGLADRRGMADRTLQRIVARARKRHGAGRSDAYRWLFERHRELSETFAAFPPEWADVAATLGSKGITGGRDRPLNGENVRRIWERVCRDVATAAAVQGTGPRPQPPRRVRAPAGWKPTPSTASVEAQAPRRDRWPADRPGEVGLPAPPKDGLGVTGDPGAPALPKEGGPLTPEQVRAMKARLQRTLDERSGR